MRTRLTVDEAVALFTSVAHSDGVRAAVRAVCSRCGYAIPQDSEDVAALRDEVAAEVGVSVEKLLYGGRPQWLADKRAVAMWVMRELGVKYKAIGEALQRDHSTCCQDVRKVLDDAKLLAVAREMLARVQARREAA